MCNRSQKKNEHICIIDDALDELIETYPKVGRSGSQRRKEKQRKLLISLSQLDQGSSFGNPILTKILKYHPEGASFFQEERVRFVRECQSDAIYSRYPGAPTVMKNSTKNTSCVETKRRDSEKRKIGLEQSDFRKKVRIESSSTSRFDPSRRNQRVKTRIKTSRRMKKIKDHSFLI